jgi:hypothetical protein
MKRQSLFRLVAVIGALHVAGLSFLFGPRHIDYTLTATLSATLIWGVVFVLNEAKRRVGFIVGVVLALIVQVVGHQIWKAELPGFWWALAQFGALQFLIACALGRTAP